MKVLVTEKIAEEGIEILKTSAEVDIKCGMSKEELLGVIPDYDAVIVRSATKIDADVIEKGINLKVVGRAGTGVDNVDVDAATKKGVMVVNTPEGNSNAAAELAIGMIFATCRHIPQAFMSCKNGDFRRSKFKGVELEGKTLGVIGLGRIGSIVASRLKAFNMKVLAFDPYIPEERCQKLGVQRCETLEELLKQADIVTLHMPKIEGSLKLIGEEQIGMMKKNAVIINCARGGLIDEEALYKALKEGQLAAAGLDVLEEEPNFEAKPGEQDFKSPILELDNVIFTPHLGASTLEAQYNVGVMVAQQISAVLEGDIVSAVNLPSLRIKDMKEIRPYIELAEKMGKIYFQVEKTPVEKIELFYSGEIAQMETKIVTLAFLKGFLEPIISDDEQVNFVNVEMIANSRGIKVVESKSNTSERFTSLVTANITNKDKALSLSGTVFGNEEIRLVDFFGYHVDFEPTTPYALAIQNIDKPGMIGRLGTILGEENVNIASMRLSRNRKGEKAEAFLGIDNEVNENILGKIRNVDGILKASLISF
ncbi:MAG: phosphoglycerate dehydrogenase [Deltaproteobacteria bacterium]